MKQGVNDITGSKERCGVYKLYFSLMMCLMLHCRLDFLLSSTISHNSVLSKYTVFDILKFGLAVRLRRHKQKLNDHVYSHLCLLFVSSKLDCQLEF